MIQAARNQVLPIGGGLYTVAYHPDEMRASSQTEWTMYGGQVRTAESLAPKFTSGFSTLATLDVAVPDAACGVLYCVGGIAGGFTAYMDDGFLKAEYNMLGVERYKASSSDRVDPGPHRIEVEVKYDAPTPQGPATITLRVDGTDVGTGRVERSVQAGFTASETFDVGADLGSPVALDYHDRAPFAFTGEIGKAHFKYI